METTIDIFVEGKQVGGQKELFPPRSISVPSDWVKISGAVTLKTVISHLVKQEVAEFEERQSTNQIFRVLTADQIETGKSSGRIDPAAKSTKQALDEQLAVRTALQAFEDGLFFVFVDGDQKEQLDDPVHLAAESTLRFIRLVALAGG